MFEMSYHTLFQNYINSHYCCFHPTSHASTKLLLLVVGNKMHGTGLSSNGTGSNQVS